MELGGVLLDERVSVEDLSRLVHRRVRQGKIVVLLLLLLCCVLMKLMFIIIIIVIVVVVFLSMQLNRKRKTGLPSSVCLHALALFGYLCRMLLVSAVRLADWLPVAMCS